MEQTGISVCDYGDDDTGVAVRVIPQARGGYQCDGIHGYRAWFVVSLLWATDRQSGRTQRLAALYQRHSDDRRLLAVRDDDALVDGKTLIKEKCRVKLTGSVAFTFHLWQSQEPRWQLAGPFFPALV